MINLTTISQAAISTQTQEGSDLQSQDIEYLKKLLFDGSIKSSTELIEYIKNNNPEKTIEKQKRIISEVYNSLNNQEDAESMELLEAIVKPAYLQQISYSWIFNDLYLSAFGLSDNNVEIEGDWFS